MIRVEQGKGRKDRYVMLSPRLLGELRAYWKLERPTTWMFVGNIPGRPITKDAVEQACQKAHRISGIAKPVRYGMNDYLVIKYVCMGGLDK